MRSATPTLIADRYEVGELLGRGGMAEVYAGVDLRLSRPVAIKLLQEAMAARNDVRVRFEAEARAAAAILQPHAVAVYDTGEHEGVPYIVMERLPGNTLADRIAAGPLLSAAEARAFGRQVLGALDAAHHVGMIHRDVKPGNILLTGDGAVKIADFGIAKSVDVTADLTGTGQLIGTPAYLAPEQLAGQPASPLTDVYALGVVLYEGLTGRKPFEGDNAMAIARAVVEGHHVPLATLRPDLDEDLVRAVARAMDIDPGARHPSAAAMGAALAPPAVPTVVPASGALLPDATEILDTTPLAPPPAPPPVPLAARRGPSPLVRAGLVALAVAAVIVLLGQLVRPQSIDGAIETEALRASSPTTTVAPSTTVPSAAAALAAELRAGANRFGHADGPAAGELAARMRAIADLVERADANAPASATALIIEVAGWRQAGLLGDGATITAIQLLQRVPGVTVAGSAAATARAPAAGDADDLKGKPDKGRGNGRDDDRDDDD